MMPSLSFLEPREYTVTGTILIQMKRSGWCALHQERNLVVEIISCIVRRALAYLTLIGAATLDLIVVLPLFLILGLSEKKHKLEMLQRVTCSIAMPILGLRVWMNALPLIHPTRLFLEDDRDLCPHDEFRMNPKMIHFTNQLLEPGSASSQLTIPQFKERYPEIQDLEMHLMYWMLKNDLLDVAERSITRGLNCNISIFSRIDRSRPALYVAIEEFKPDFVKLLLKSGASPKNSEILSAGDYLIEILKALYLQCQNISPLHEKISLICWHLMQHEDSITFPPTLTTPLENFSLSPFIALNIRCEHNLASDQGESLKKSYDTVKRELETLQKKYKQEKKKAIQEGICEGAFPKVLVGIIEEYLN